jgi:hypothetical protein
MSNYMCSKAPTVGFSDAQRPACGTGSMLLKDPGERMAEGAPAGRSLCLSFSPLFSPLPQVYIE